MSTTKATTASLATSQGASGPCHRKMNVPDAMATSAAGVATLVYSNRNSRR